MLTKVTIQGNIIAVTEFSSVNRKCHAVKVDADHYIDTETGELREYKHVSTSRTDNMQELRATFARIRALINANCTDPERLRLITLTYAENMTDTERLKRDFEAFIKRFRRRWGACEYIDVVEPQARGAWHHHLIPIYEGKAPYIPNAELAECWGHGFVKVESLDDVDNVGAYLSAYLADAETEDGTGTEKTLRNGQRKRVVKGGRLHMYPKGMKICRHSNGLVKPEQFWVESQEDIERAADAIEGATETFKRTFKIEDEKGRTYSGVVRYFNRVRKPQKGQRPSDCWLLSQTRRRDDYGS